jgi:hypothetical protein
MNEKAYVSGCCLGINRKVWRARVGWCLNAVGYEAEADAISIVEVASRFATAEPSKQVFCRRSDHSGGVSPAVFRRESCVEDSASAKMLVPRKASSGSVLPRYQDTDYKVLGFCKSCTAASSRSSVWWGGLVLAGCGNIRCS